MPKAQEVNYQPGDGETLFVIVAAADEEGTYVPLHKLKDSQLRLWEDIAEAFLRAIAEKHHVV